MNTSESPGEVMGEALYAAFKSAARDLYGKVVEIGARSLNTGNSERAAVAIDSYLKAMSKEVTRARIWKMSESFSLDDVFTPVRVAATTVEKGQDVLAQARIGIWTSDLGEDLEDGQKVLEDHSRIVLLGRPGGGKTTLVKSILGMCIRRRFLESTGGVYWPVYIQARELAGSGEAIFEAITAKLTECGFEEAGRFVGQLCESGRCLLAVDGLDEVSSLDEVREVADRIDKFSRNFPQARIIVACRDAAYEKWFDGFQEVYIAPWRWEQVVSFVHAWFEGIKAQQCLDSILKRPQAVDFSSSPLLLTLICWSFEESGDISSNRSYLYREAIAGMLGRRDALRGIHRVGEGLELSRHVAETFYARLAYDCLQSGRDEWNRREVENALEHFAREYVDHKGQAVDGEQILRALEVRHGILMSLPMGRVAFSHRSFRDYYAADYLTSQSQREDLNAVVDQCLDDLRYGGVIQFLAGMLNDATPFVSKLSEKVFDYLEYEQALQRMVELFKNTRMSTPVVTRGLGFFCVVYQVMPVVMALERAMPSTVGSRGARDYLTKLSNDLNADFYITAGHEETEQELTSELMRTALESDEVMKLEALGSVLRGRAGTRANLSNLYQLLGPAPSRRILREVDLDLEREDVKAELQIVFDFGFALRRCLRRSLLLADALTSGGTMSVAVREDLSERLFPAGFEQAD